MTVAEREPFEQIARQEKARNRGVTVSATEPRRDRLDNQGVLIADRMDYAMVKAKRMEQEMERVRCRWPEGSGMYWQRSCS